MSDHTDEFKTQTYFSPGDIVFDPFCGSGTTLVQANELGMHGVGVDVSTFNSLIGNLKLAKVSLDELSMATGEVADSIERTSTGCKAREFERELLAELSAFNSANFPAPEFRAKVRTGEIDEKQYSTEKEQLFLARYRRILNRFSLKTEPSPGADRFLDNWFIQPILDEMTSALKVIDQCSNPLIGNYLRMILSRTARSCRATTHYDLATLTKPQIETYYCAKHSKICKPLFSCLKWWRRYSNDTIRRLGEFAQLRTDALQICLTGDSRNIDIANSLRDLNPDFHQVYQSKKIRGIFSSPPYVGLINYHEQHAYSYELFEFERNDDLEIGAMFNGQGKQAKLDYTRAIADVLLHAKNSMIDEFDVFLVVNDKFNLYPEIARLAGMRIINEYRRPVLNRAEGVTSAYSESIFHLVHR